MEHISNFILERLHLNDESYVNINKSFNIYKVKPNDKIYFFLCDNLTGYSGGMMNVTEILDKNEYEDHYVITISFYIPKQLNLLIPKKLYNDNDSYLIGGKLASWRSAYTVLFDNEKNARIFQSNYEKYEKETEELPNKFIGLKNDKFE